MKIRNKLTLKYAGVTAVVFSFILLTVYLSSERSREHEFYHELTNEAVTKANMILCGKVDAETMQLIYHNKRNRADEAKIAVYSSDFELIYHDAQEIDIVRETPELLKSAAEHRKLEFYVDNYQAIAMTHTFNGIDYIITAVEFDYYGHVKQKNLATLLIVLWISGLAVLVVVGHLLACISLRPIRRIMDRMADIRDSCLDNRFPVKKEHDELDELSETFNLMLDQLERSFDNQKMFICNVAHELRTPLAALMGGLEVSRLREQRTVEEYKAIIAAALYDAANLKQLTNGLLDLATADYDANRIPTTELRLDELLVDARETVLKANRDYTVDLVFEGDAEDDRMITVMGSEYLLKTAFINLIENNCKFSGDKTSVVRISFSDEISFIQFYDTGIGIAEEDMDRIFTPFYRGSNAAHIKGKGIGLPLTRKIILLHKGKITVRSQIGEGTAFIVEIPHI